MKWIALLGMLGLIAAPARAQIVFGQIDTFTGGTTADWSEGGSSPNPPTNIATGGPGGVGDAFLQNISSGIGSAGAKMIMFNGSQWTGDYGAAGVSRINAHMANFGPTQLFMRVTITGGAGTQFSSTDAFALPADGQWYPVIFDLTPSELTLISGSDSLAATLANVQQLRILSAEFGPAFNGDTIAGDLGTDNILATTAVPEPTSLALCGVAFGAAAWRRRRNLRR